MTDTPLTKYPKRAHLLLCSSGVSCNNAEKRRASFDAEALKKRWYEEKHGRLCFLQITNCMGICDLGNSGCLILPNKTYWLGGLTETHHEALIAWLEACRDLDEAEPLLPLPEVILAQEVQRLESYSA